MTAALGAWGKGHRCDALRKNHLRSQRVKPDSVARIPSTWTVFMLRQEDCCDFKASLHTEKCFLKYTREQTSSRRSRRVWLVKSLSLGPIPLQECHVCDAGLCSLEIMHPIKYPLRLLPNPCIRGLLGTGPLLCWMHFSVVSIVAVRLSPSRQSERMERTWLNLESPGAG